MSIHAANLFLVVAYFEFMCLAPCLLFRRQTLIHSVIGNFEMVFKQIVIFLVHIHHNTRDAQCMHYGKWQNRPLWKWTKCADFVLYSVERWIFVHTCMRIVPWQVPNYQLFLFRIFFSFYCENVQFNSMNKRSFNDWWIKIVGMTAEMVIYSDVCCETGDSILKHQNAIGRGGR